MSNVDMMIFESKLYYGVIGGTFVVMNVCNTYSAYFS